MIRIDRFRLVQLNSLEHIHSVNTESTNPPDRPKLSDGDRVERPWTVADAADFLGVSPQTVYLWVERRSIPHFRIMGRNIRFLRSDLEVFRASFKQDIERQ